MFYNILGSIHLLYDIFSHNLFISLTQSANQRIGVYVFANIQYVSADSDRLKWLKGEICLNNILNVRSMLTQTARSWIMKKSVQSFGKIRSV